MDELVVEAYKKAGFDVEEVKGNSRHGQHMVAINYDGVQYALNHHGRMNGSTPDIDVADLKKVQSTSHTKIKQIYQYLMSLNIGDIWAMVSKDQVFFGNKFGYVAILYIEGKKKLLRVNFAKNDKYFNGKISRFEIDGIKLETHWEIYGQYEEFDAEYDLIYNQ